LYSYVFIGSHPDAEVKQTKQKKLNALFLQAEATKYTLTSNNQISN